MGLVGYQLAMLIIGKAAGGLDTVVAAENPSGFSPYLGSALILLANSSDSVSLLNQACNKSVETMTTTDCMVEAAFAPCRDRVGKAPLTLPREPPGFGAILNRTG